MSRPTHLLHFLQYARRSHRLIQSVALAFVLSLCAAIASPVVQAQSLSPDQQFICLGTGGMKLVTFAADGTAQDAQIAHTLDCPLCLALQAPSPAIQARQSLPAIPHAQPLWIRVSAAIIFENRTPPARAPPLAS
ncbi:MAG: hypothetical protein QM533_06540 [Cytophagales bacterium]|nr:hypothetical protein [Cytophagales bacterium]